MAELSFIAGRQHLELGNRLLIELCGCSTVDRVFVRLSVNQKIVIAAPLAQHRVSVIAVGVELPVDGYSGHELQQVEVIPPVDGKLRDLARRDSRAGGRRIRFQQGLLICAHVDHFSNISNFHLHIESQDPIERHLDICGTGSKACV